LINRITTMTIIREINTLNMTTLIIKINITLRIMTIRFNTTIKGMTKAQTKITQITDTTKTSMASLTKITSKIMIRMTTGINNKNLDKNHSKKVPRRIQTILLSDNYIY
jgi:hypothetical protein